MYAGEPGGGVTSTKQMGAVIVRLARRRAVRLQAAAVARRYERKERLGIESRVPPADAATVDLLWERQAARFGDVLAMIAAATDTSSVAPLPRSLTREDLAELLEEYEFH